MTIISLIVIGINLIRDVMGNNKILYFKLYVTNKYIWTIFEITNNEYICGEFVFYKSSITQACLSKLDKILYLCETNHNNADSTLCKAYKFDLKVDKKFDLEKLGIRITHLTLIDNKDVFFVNFFIDDNINVSSTEHSNTNLFNRFFLIHCALKY